MIQDLTAQDLIATGVTFGVAISWLRLMEFFAQRQWLPQTLSRKIIHIGTGLLFVLCWVLFSHAAIARYLAALVPLAFTLQFLAIGTGRLSDPAAVQAMTRHGKPAELLRGPFYYGIMVLLCTIFFWRNSPIGILALMLMCGGDGLADIVGRRWGKHKLPFNADKSWAGSVAMWGGGFIFAYGILALFNTIGYFQPPLNLFYAAKALGAIAFLATLVEALPFKDIDNITLTATAIILGLWWF